MSEPFLAEIRIVGFNFPPRGWAQCDGQILPINQNQSLFSLLGTTYGGDGRTTFALPDLRARAPIHEGQGIGLPSSYALGEKGGEDDHVLTTPEIPAHTHLPLQATNTDGSSQAPSGNVLARTVSLAYEAAAPAIGPDIQPGTVSFVGAGQGHENEMPYLALNFVIALQGLFPSRN